MTPKERKAAPALYELVGTGRSNGTPVRSRRVEEDPTPASEELPVVEGEFGPGRSVRMPAGTLFFFAFGVLVALFAGYLIGYKQKEGEISREASRLATQQADLPIRDPLDDLPVNNALVQDDTPREADTRRNRVNPTPEPPDRTRGAGNVIVEGRVADPRTEGLNYLALTSMGMDRVQSFLDHLAEEGVDAAAYPVNNGVYRVFALRGFTRDQYRNERGPFEERLRDLTERYRDEQGRGVTYDPFWDKH